ncbi:CGH_3_HP_G0030780.mRNA.1.CDS.1 [Saccharomyces cerevisiae]|nr:CGH_3_HP_G0030780.mRNA.1.CDS.1 [Saccharomyces cerevisiae]CAI6465252.1 CGH_3_HP_G0030780.mRNA.1.CDS.1 [Saccharomyces cerevisiae]
MLMVTTTVRVINWIHGNTTGLWPSFFFNLYLWKARPAFNNGLSTLPPPAMTPMTPLASEEITFLAPDGNLTLVLFSSGL